MRTVCCFIAAAMIVTVSDQPAAAILAFYKVFEAEYLDNHSDKDFAALVKKPANRCYVCHVGKKRTHRNVFGKELEKLLDKEKDAKDKEKIAAAIKKVCDLPSDPNDEKSETFGKRIAESKWPAGELDDLKKEPAEE